MCLYILTMKWNSYEKFLTKAYVFAISKKELRKKGPWSLGKYMNKYYINLFNWLIFSYKILLKGTLHENVI